MKALYKLIAVCITAIILTGCAGHMGTILGATAGAAINGTKGAFVGGLLGAAVDHDAARYAPRGVATQGFSRHCDPAQADGLMAWATELDNPYQKRAARVSNSNGRVSCYSSESAGSQSGAQRIDSGYGFSPTGNVPVYRWTPPTNRGSRIIDLQ